MENIIVVINIILAIILVVVVLLQRSEGGALDLVFHKIISRHQDL